MGAAPSTTCWASPLRADGGSSAASPAAVRPLYRPRRRRHKGRTSPDSLQLATAASRNRSGGCNSGAASWPSSWSMQRLKRRCRNPTECRNWHCLERTPSAEVSVTILNDATGRHSLLSLINRFLSEEVNLNPARRRRLNRSTKAVTEFLSQNLDGYRSNERQGSYAQGTSSGRWRWSVRRRYPGLHCGGPRQKTPGLRWRPPRLPRP